MPHLDYLTSIVRLCHHNVALLFEVRTFADAQIEMYIDGCLMNSYSFESRTPA